MTNINENAADTVQVTASTTKEIKVAEGGVEKINITQIPFIPEISTMNLSTFDIVRALNATLRPIIDGYKGAKVYVKGNVFGVEIGIDSQSKIISKSVLRMLGEKAAYEMSDELKAKLTPFVNANASIKNRIVDVNRNQQVMIIELDALRVINQLLQLPIDGFVYRLDKIIDRKKNGESMFQISMVKKNRPYEQRNDNNGHNNNNNRNDRNNNNNNRNDRNRDNDRDNNYRDNDQR